MKLYEITLLRDIEKGMYGLCLNLSENANPDINPTMFKYMIEVPKI